MSQKNLECLKLISTNEPVFISRTEGAETLASAIDMFDYMDPNFKAWGCDSVEFPTDEMEVSVYEQIKDADYPEIFGSFGTDLDLLCLTTAQIKSFVLHNAKEYMLDNAEWTCFRFLFSAHGKLFIADVRIHSNNKRDIRVTRFLQGNVRHSIYRHRIIVPLISSWRIG